MVVLGIDPGTLHLGWGVVRSSGSRVVHLGHGVIDAPSRWTLARRLLHLEQGLAEVIERFEPAAGSVESLFFHKDAQAAAKLGHARGVVLLSLARAQVPVFEYPPARVKSTIAGHGRADKSQMVRMVRTLLSLSEPPREDAADALALAMTYVRRARVELALGRRAAAGGGPAPSPSGPGVSGPGASGPGVSDPGVSGPGASGRSASGRSASGRSTASPRAASRSKTSRAGLRLVRRV